MSEPEFGTSSTSQGKVASGSADIGAGGAEYVIFSDQNSGDTPALVDLVSAFPENNDAREGLAIVVSEEDLSNGRQWSVTIPVTGVPWEPDSPLTIAPDNDLRISGINYTGTTRTVRANSIQRNL